MHLHNLTQAFQKEARFADGYSDTYQAIFEILAAWGEGLSSETLVDTDAQSAFKWLVDVSDGRIPFEISLLTAAGLHELVLEGLAPDLAVYYPTAGGTHNAQAEDTVLQAILARTILTNQPMLKEVIQKSMVQTNETGRGLAWLLPLYYTGWEKVDLLDLGASAGLNLMADRRGYLLQGESPDNSLRLGLFNEIEFESSVAGDVAWEHGRSDKSVPHIMRRTGCDIAPFVVDSLSKAHRLQSYIWADQVSRMNRLKRGLAVLDAYKADGGSIELFEVELPQELTPFLEQSFSDPTANYPLVIYNTFVTQYFRDERGPFIEQLTGWAAAQTRPILWLQWEPPLSDREGGLSDHGEARLPSEYGWLGWVADLWLDHEHHHFQLGWVHPHAKGMRFLPGLSEWQTFFMER